MAAKVKWDRDAWWVVTHFEGKRRKRRVGPAKAHKREAEEIGLDLYPFEDEYRAAKGAEEDSLARQMFAGVYDPIPKDIRR